MILTIHVKPNARENKITGWLDDTTLKASVTAAPEKGKANEAVIKLLAESLDIPKSSIVIIRGTTTRMKQVTVPDHVRLLKTDGTGTPATGQASRL